MKNTHLAISINSATFSSQLDNALINYDKASANLVELALTAVAHYQQHGNDKAFIVVMAEKLAARPRFKAGFINLVLDCTMLNRTLEKRKLTKAAKKAASELARKNLTSYWAMFGADTLTTLSGLKRITDNRKQAQKPSNVKNASGKETQAEAKTTDERAAQLTKAKKAVEVAKRKLQDAEAEYNSLLDVPMLTTDEKIQHGEAAKLELKAEQQKLATSREIIEAVAAMVGGASKSKLQTEIQAYLENVA